MAENLNLERDEIVIIQETSVSHGGVMAPNTDELILTNKKLICVNKGVFGGSKKVFHYPLNQLKAYNGVPQARMEKKSNGTPCLALYFLNGQQEHFSFDWNNKKKINRFIDEINKLFGILDSNASKENKGIGGPLSDAFKGVGGAFAEVGRSFASAFGFKSKDKNNKKDEVNCENINDNITIKQNSDDDYDEDDFDEDDVDNEYDEDDEDEESEDEYMSNYKLDKDEVILKHYECVYLNGSIENTADTLLITNKNIVVEYETGSWKTTQHIDKFSYSEIKFYNGQPQVKLGKYDDEPVLELYFTNGYLYLNFSEEGNKKKQIALINELVDMILGACPKNVQESHESLSEGEKIKCKYCGKELSVDDAFCTSCGRSIKDSQEVNIETDKWICAKCGKENKKSLKFCTECGSKRDDRIENKNIEKSNDQNNSKSKLSLDEQIELLNKLKSLVDAGVLTQEEFEKKKKEIL